MISIIKHYKNLSIEDLERITGLNRFQISYLLLRSFLDEKEKNGKEG
jgi:hypothetical protein